MAYKGCFLATEITSYLVQFWR